MGDGKATNDCKKHIAQIKRKRQNRGGL